jgi:hypothetical protein
VHLLACGHEDTDQRHENVATPQAAYEGLARAHRATECGIGVYLRMIELQRASQVESCKATTEHLFAAVRLHEPQLAVLELAQLPEH